MSAMPASTIFIHSWAFAHSTVCRRRSPRQVLIVSIGQAKRHSDTVEKRREGTKQPNANPSPVARDILPQAQSSSSQNPPVGGATARCPPVLVLILTLLNSTHRLRFWAASPPPAHLPAHRLPPSPAEERRRVGGDSPRGGEREPARTDACGRE